jgi:hypothetical protein
MKKNRFRTDFLLPKNNFFIGMGSVLNLKGNYFEYNTSKSDLEADRNALFSDWWNVGNDMDTVLQNTKNSK